MKGLCYHCERRAIGAPLANGALLRDGTPLIVCDPCQGRATARLNAESDAETRADNAYWSARAKAGVVLPCD